VNLLPLPRKKPAEKDDESWSQWFELAKTEWYFGDIDRKEAERLLFQCTEDAFLVRKSSVKNSFAVSIYNHKKQTVNHTLIESRSGGFAFQDTPKVYNSLVELIKISPECKGLKSPRKL